MNDYKEKYLKYKSKYLNLKKIINQKGSSNKSDDYKEDISKCYSNTMSKNEEKHLFELIDVWTIVSEKEEIRWSVCAGSYIGLKRDGGRILWDDDFDITIMKEDLNKLKNVKDKLNEYNVSIWEWEKGYKIFFTDDRGINYTPKKEYTWPFVDIFTLDEDKECAYINQNEGPLNKVKFGNTEVYVYENPNKSRNSVGNTSWKDELYDKGWRHQTDEMIKTECSSKKKE